MKTITAMIDQTPIPKMVKIREVFDNTCIPVPEIPAVLRRELEPLSAGIQPGMRIAITCGSRGINHNALMVKTMVDFLKAKGAEPFIVAAMGSHGGATAEGQLQILTDYGITETALGCPVKSCMDTVEIGRSEIRGQAVRIDKNAAQADGILLFNRIKPHTSFRGRYESGLMKMMAIGLGKQHGAHDLHSQSPAIMHELVEEYGRTILKNAPILGGIAVVENAYDETYLIKGLDPQGILDQEPQLKDLSYQTIAHLLFDKCDVLVVDKIGKNISGDGMDPNVSGRFVQPKYCSGGIQAEKVVVLDITDETHGNAQGVGLADCTTRRLFNRMKLEMTYPTGVTNTFLHLMKIPMIMDNDREALQLALSCCPE
ncbi:MAG: lactate racemase domain-containing protein, partial [Oscillibacter sp.]